MKKISPQKLRHVSLVFSIMRQLPDIPYLVPQCGTLMAMARLNLLSMPWDGDLDVVISNEAYSWRLGRLASGKTWGPRTNLDATAIMRTLAGTLGTTVVTNATEVTNDDLGKKLRGLVFGSNHCVSSSCKSKDICKEMAVFKIGLQTRQSNS